MPGTLSLFGLTHLDVELYPAAQRRCLAQPGLFLCRVPPPETSAAHPRTAFETRRLDGIGEAKSYEEIFVLASASGLDAAIAMEGQHGVAGGSEATRW